MFRMGSRRPLLSCQLVTTGYYTLLAQGFREHAARAAVVARGGRVSFAELDERSARIAAYLTRLGASPGDRVAARIERSPEALCLFLACLRAGFVYVPINP